MLENPTLPKIWVGTAVRQTCQPVALFAFHSAYLARSKTPHQLLDSQEGSVTVPLVVMRRAGLTLTL